MRLTETIQPSTGRDLHGLEIIRFACTVPILLLHYQHFYMVGQGWPADWATVQQTQPFFWLLRPFYLYGGSAVQVFWCLSGFIFTWKYAGRIRDRSVTLGRFALLRFSRLYPLHLLTLCIVAVLAWQYMRIRSVPYVYGGQDVKHFVMQLFMASNWTAASGSSFNGPIWSVSIEVLVYGIFFALCWVGVTRVWLLVPLTAGAWWLFEYRWPFEPISGCLFLFYVGALTACFYRTLAARTVRVKAVVAAAGIVALTVGTRMVAVGEIAVATYVQTMTPVLIVVMVLAVRPRRQGVRRGIETLGNLTYSSYLWHFPIQLAVTLWFVNRPHDRPVGSPWFLLAFLVATYGVSALSYRFIELPAQMWIRQRRRVPRIEVAVTGQAFVS